MKPSLYPIIGMMAFMGRVPMRKYSKAENEAAVMAAFTGAGKASKTNMKVFVIDGVEIEALNYRTALKKSKK